MAELALLQHLLTVPGQQLVHRQFSFLPAQQIQRALGPLHGQQHAAIFINNNNDNDSDKNYKAPACYYVMIQFLSTIVMIFSWCHD